MKVTLIIAAIVASAFAEPPVPSSQYGAPSNQYGAPAQTSAIIRPSNQYGPPNNQYIPPNNQYIPPSGVYGPPGGKNGGYEDQTEPANYNFEYHVQDAESGNDFGHEEERQGDVAKGRYFVLLPDGRRQIVEYVADNDGYKPKISYEGGGNGGGYKNGGYPSGGRNGYNGGGNGGYQY